MPNRTRRLEARLKAHHNDQATWPESVFGRDRGPRAESSANSEQTIQTLILHPFLNRAASSEPPVALPAL
jgi:hypothetical protein